MKENRTYCKPSFSCINENKAGLIHHYPAKSRQTGEGILSRLCKRTADAPEQRLQEERRIRPRMDALSNQDREEKGKEIRKEGREMHLLRSTSQRYTLRSCSAKRKPVRSWLIAFAPRSMRKHFYTREKLSGNLYRFDYEWICATLSIRGMRTVLCYWIITWKYVDTLKCRVWIFLTSINILLTKYVHPRE